MNSKSLFTIVVLLFSTTLAFAQTFEEYKQQTMREFQQYKSKQEKAFQEYRDRINAEYAAMMQQMWESYDAHAAVKRPTRPEPPKPVVKEPKAQSEPQPKVEPQPKPEPIPQQKPEVEPQPRPEPQPKTEPKPQPQPEPESEPKPEPKPVQTPSMPSFKFNYYGMMCSVGMDDSFHYSLNDTSNQTIAGVWQLLSNQKSYDLVEELLKIKSLLSLCDWGYIMLTEKMTTAYYGSRNNEARLMQIFLLIQSGYKARIAICNNNITLMLPIEDPQTDVYGYPYLLKDGVKYYIMDKISGQTSVSFFDKEFPNEKLCSLAIDQRPVFMPNPSASRTLQSKRYSQIAFNLSTNVNLVNFYNDYPQISDWSVYVNAPFGEDTHSLLYNKLKAAIADKSKTEAANMLLDFVQTAFAYRTDQEQFGYERPLFSEELLYYPYCDCEDRSIFYARLVKDLLGLEVVLINYPGHLATAVCFGQDIPGTYIVWKDRRYYICDPTYINSSIGDQMPNMTQIIDVIEVN